jgi:hypothetical protein
MNGSNSVRHDPDTHGPGPRYAAVGIPQGIILDPDNKEQAGAVRRGGELVSLEPVQYVLWAALLTPLTMTASAKIAAACHWGDPEPVIRSLADQDLLVTIDPGQPMSGALARLRPIPLGYSLGNAGGDTERFEIQGATLSLTAPLALDVVSVMFWWEFDGATSLHEAVTSITSRVPALPLYDASIIAARLAYDLMLSRMLYLDTPRKVKS